MKVTLIFEEKLSPLDVDPSIQIGTLKSLAQGDLGLAASNMSVLLAGRTLNDSQSLTASGVKDGDLLQVARKPVLPSASDTARAAQAFQMDIEDRQRMVHLDADPFNPETQARIAEEIRRKNIEENMAMAIEHNPESFARVVMLYIPIKVNGVQLTAFVDSGAQSTIMSMATAERCNIHHLIDRRFQGLAKGVGTAKIVGRVHNTRVDIGGTLIMCSFTILEHSDIDLLFGLDQLRKHQASIDLKENCLRVYEKSIPFLQEKDLPIHVKREDHGVSDPPSSSSSSSSSSSNPSSSSTSRNHTPMLAPTSGNRGAIPSSSSLLRPSASSTQNPSPSSSPAPRGPSPAAHPTPSANPASAAAALAAALGLRTPLAPSATASGSTPPASAGGSSALPAGVTEEKIRKLVELGFSREESIRALVRAGGNEDMAASFLF